MLKVDNLTFTYSRRQPPVLDSFNLEIEKGGVYGLLGSNGAGKTTLLYLISGLLTPGEGIVTWNGINTRKRCPVTVADIFIVPEEMDLPSISIRKFAELNGVFYPKFSLDEMISHLELFEISPELNAGKLSMGQKKKVILSFAMACNTSVLILDEPTNGLDIPGKNAFRRFIARSASDDRIFIISTHQVRDVSQILDHVIIIDNRKVLFDHSISEIQSKLRFVDTVKRDLVDSSLFSVNSTIGTSVVLPNTDGNDTDVNLEVLFSFAHEDPEGLNNVFHSK